MLFNKHREVQGMHATLSASKYSWVNKDDDAIIEMLTNQMATTLGTRLHAWAAEAIELKLRQGSAKTTLNMYINDAIKFRMTPEQVVFYSRNIFGTADTISYRAQPKTGRWLLRVHDLKTGTSKASFLQLMIYAAIFCHEYNILPGQIDIELRIYQNDDILICTTLDTPETEILDLALLVEIMGKIKHNDELIEKTREEAAA
jgi:hypothetical protein